jgi:hypothetical protein
MKFKKGDKVITSCGYEGVVVACLDYCNGYEVRLPGGVAVRFEYDLKLKSE